MDGNEVGIWSVGQVLTVAAPPLLVLPPLEMTFLSSPPPPPRRLSCSNPMHTRSHDMIRCLCFLSRTTGDVTYYLWHSQFLCTLCTWTSPSSLNHPRYLPHCPTSPSFPQPFFANLPNLTNLVSAHPHYA